MEVLLIITIALFTMTIYCLFYIFKLLNKYNELKKDYSDTVYDLEMIIF